MCARYRQDDRGHHVAARRGLAFSLADIGGQYVITLWLLAARRKLPWRLLRFLEDAHRRGVLRQQGATYQFRHARLHERLAR